MTVRCKMRLIAKTDRAPYNGPSTVQQSEVEFAAVSGDENKAWSKWTPSGSLKLSITNPDAVNALKLGAEYFVDIIEAEPIAAAVALPEPSAR